MDARDSGKPTRWRSSSVKKRIAFSSCQRENFSTSLQIKPSKYYLCQRCASSSHVAKQGSGNPPRVSKCVTASAGSAAVCVHHSRVEIRCNCHAKNRPANDSPACRNVSSRTLPVTGSCCLAGLPSNTPSSQGFQSGILWISSSTNSVACEPHLTLKTTARWSATS